MHVWRVFILFVFDEFSVDVASCFGLHAVNCYLSAAISSRITIIIIIIIKLIITVRPAVPIMECVRRRPRNGQPLATRIYERSVETVIAQSDYEIKKLPHVFSYAIYRNHILSP